MQPAVIGLQSGRVRLQVQGHRDVHLAPGASHHRLALAQLCEVPGLLQDMQRGERLDLAFYAFAQVSDSVSK